MKGKVLLFYGMFEDNQSYAYVPWSMFFLATYLRKHEYEPIIIDEFVTPDFEAIIRDNAEDTILFGVSAMTCRQITAGIDAIRIFRKYNKTAKVAWGGAHSTANPDETLQNELIDYVFVGQSFISLPKLLGSIHGEGKDNNRRVICSEYPTREHLLEFPDFELEKLNFNKYINPETRLLNYCSSIGCPGSCSFCSWGGKHNRYSFPVDRIINDVELLVKKYDLTTVLIQDATFFSNKEMVMSFAEQIIRKNIRCFWRAGARVIELNKFTRDDFKLLASSGLDWIFVGVENTVPRIMKMFKKVFPVEMVDNILNNLKGVDIIFFTSMIFGVPTETTGELLINKKNIERWLKINNNFYCQKCIFTPYSGTPLTDLAIKHGFNPPQSLEDWAKHPLFVDTRRSLETHRTWLTPSFQREYFEILSGIAAGRSRNTTLKPAGTRPERQ